jgi:drug/metabolite transporter (DMT)-like permease
MSLLKRSGELLNHNRDWNMPELNLHHIDQITRDVHMQEIGFSHLFHDLVDHICCDIEYEMQQGLPFDEAYRKVKAKIGFRGLKRIQEDTLYVVDSKYRNMKKLMKISGVTGTIMLGFAAIFNHWPLAGMLITLGAFVLSFLFLPSALVVLWKETKNQKKLILFISAFIAGVAFIFGMLFKIQHWPVANIAILAGLVTGAFLFVPSLLIQLFGDNEKKHKRFLYVIGAISVLIYATGFWFRILHWPIATTFLMLGAFVLFFFALPRFTWIQWKNETNVNGRFIFMVIAPLLFVLPGALVNLDLERIYENGFYIRLKKQDALIKLQEKANDRFLIQYQDSVSSVNMEGIHSATGELIAIINLVVQNMAAVADENAKEQNQSLLELKGSNDFDPAADRFPSASFSTRPVSLMLLPGCKARDVLEKGIDKYEQKLITQLGTEWIKMYDPLMNASEYLPGSNTQEFELVLLPYLNSLSLLKSGILITESAALKQIAEKK